MVIYKTLDLGLAVKFFNAYIFSIADIQVASSHLLQ